MKIFLKLLLVFALCALNCSRPIDPDVDFGVIIEGPGVFTSASAGLVTTESGGLVTIQVRLKTKPKADVSLHLQSSNASEGRIKATSGVCDSTVATVTANSCKLTFTPENWQQSQAVAVVGQDDTARDGDIAYTIFFPKQAESADEKYNGLSPAAISLKNSDNDIPGVTFSPMTGSTAEAGGTFTFTAVLNTQPTADVTLTLASSNTGEGRLKRTTGVCNTTGSTATGTCTMTFTTLNWNIAQSATVVGQDDAVVDGDINYAIIASALTSADANYNGVDPADIILTSTDNGSPGYTFSATSGLTTSESAGTATFTVRLNTAPATNVTVNLTSSNTAEGTVSPASLVFTPLNWSNTQTVTLTGVADNTIDGNIAYSITTATAGGSDAVYLGINPPDVSATNNNTDAGKYIFISNAAIGGAAGSGADFTCNNDTINKPRPGTYWAILASEAADDFTVLRDRYVNWVLAANQKYYRGVDSKLIGTTDSVARLPSTLTNSFHTSGLTYWTGLNSDYSFAGLNTCKNMGEQSWSRSIPGLGVVGTGTAVNGNAISGGTAACNTSQRLLCAEQ